MTDRLRNTRRYGIHIPQLVGRVSYPTPDERPEAGIMRIPRQLDDAMSELQRFLHYLQNANDQSVQAGGFYEDEPTMVDGADGDPGTPGIGYALGDHKHEADIGAPVGLGNANATGSGTQLAGNDHVHKRDVRVQLEGADVGTRNRINYTASVTTPTDNPGNDRVDVPLSTADDDTLAFAMLGY